MADWTLDLIIESALSHMKFGYADQDTVPQRERIEEVRTQAQDWHSQGGVQVIDTHLIIPIITIQFTYVARLLVYRASNT